MERTEDWKTWKAILKQAGVRDVRVHDARHTAATLLVEQGVNIRVV
ncbi:tyrosine-type recombinase/integrase [Streptosporangium fragile]